MQESDLFEEMQALEAAIQPDEVIFVLDGTIGQAAYPQAKAFAEKVNVGSIIITKLDSSAKGGGALSAVAATQSPIAFYGTGEGMTLLEEFNAQGFVSRMLGRGDLLGMVRRIEEINPEQQKELAESIVRGHFTFREMREQYQMAMQMGDLGGLMDVMGMGRVDRAVQDAGVKMEDVIKRNLCVIDAMTKQELDHPELLRQNESRKRRIARGCGLTCEQVQAVVEEQKTMAKFIDKIPPHLRPSLVRVDGGKGQPNQRQMQQNVQQFARALDPQMLQRMGGTGALANLMEMERQAGQQARGGAAPLAGKPGTPGRRKR
jgi:signal recognition particle subunit SRP54